MLQVFFIYLFIFTFFIHLGLLPLNINPITVHLNHAIWPNPILIAKTSHVFHLEHELILDSHWILNASSNILYILFAN